MSRAAKSAEPSPNLVWQNLEQIGDEWSAFWFRPAQPHTLCLIRFLVGWMLLYTHLVWTIGLNDFLGPDAWLNRETARELTKPFYVWSPLFHFDNPAAVWCYHLASIVAMLLLMVGWKTRITSVVAWLFAVSYCHRLQGALFGLDQTSTMLAMYLMIGESGAAYSVDRWLAKRRGEKERPGAVSTNIAIRLIQIHLCVIYFFSAVGKMKGDTWWDGSAVWFAVASLEYQSFDMTWIGRYPALIALMSHVTVFWELTYPALIWPRRTRPLMLAIAVGVHGGIALSLGMITFGMAMLYANLSFVPPETTKRFVSWLGRVTRISPGQGETREPT